MTDYRNDPKWLRVVAFLRSLGAPEPYYRDGWPDEAFFTTFTPRHDIGPHVVHNVTQGIYMYLGRDFPGVTATDLWQAKQIKLGDVYASWGVPNLSIDELEKIVPWLKGERTDAV